MSLRAGLGLGLSLVLVLVACGGTVSGVGNGNGSSGSSGTSGSGGDPGSSGSNGSSGSSGGPGTCSSGTFPGDLACVPGTARANTPITIAVAAKDGCLGCFTSFEPCSVVVSGDHITLSMATKTCQPAGDVGCPAICQLPRTTCTVPGLAPGKYTVEVTGDKPRVGLPPRELVVTADATKTSCTLPPPGTMPPTLDGTSYAKSCSVDDDCAVATVGNLCTPCKCPNLAIAKTASATYEADAREITSQCPGTDAPIACAACKAVKAKCESGPGDLTGTCTLVASP